MYFGDQFNPERRFLNPGDILDNRYQITEVLGEGGFGTTYKAKDLRKGNEIVVVKQLKNEFCDAQAGTIPKQLFHREAKALLVLKNSQMMIPRLETDVIEHDGYVYFVMEYIQGKTLEQQELQEGNMLSEEEVIKLLKDMLRILNFIHEKGFLHLDIKPDNIMRRDGDNGLTLIDFGSVTKIVTSSSFTPIGPIGNHYYSSPEQLIWEGKVERSSDLYPLGIMAIQGLTGQSPRNFDFLRDPQTDEIDLNLLETKVSVSLKKLIEKIVRYSPSQRYQSADEVLTELNYIQPDSPLIKPPPKKRIFFPIVGLIPLAFYLGFYLGFYLRKPYQSKRSNSSNIALEKCFSLNFPERLVNPKYKYRSLGEKRLVPKQETSERIEKLNQVEQAIKNCHLDYAIAKLQEVILNNRKNYQNPDPEILIYQSNLKALKSQRPLIQIVVSLPLDDSPSDLEVLRGVAMAQYFHNRSESHNLLLIEIAKDDRTNKSFVKILAQKFIDDSKIKAVIGHRSSNASLWAAPVYQSGQLVMISPTSSTQKLAAIGDDIFQMAVNNDILATSLVKYINDTTSIRDILICHTENSDYSISFANSILEKFKGAKKETKISNQPCFKNVITYDPQFILSILKKEQIQGLILIPSTDPKRLNQARQLVKEIKKQNLAISIFGSSTLYGGETFKDFSDFQNMILTVPSHPDINPEFAKRSREMWKGSVTWRTMTAFDATQAVIEALKNSQTLSRQDLQRNLSKPTFQFQGATGNVTFSTSGARQGKGCIVKISNSNLKKKGTPFQLIKCDDFLSE